MLLLVLVLFVSSSLTLRSFEKMKEPTVESSIALRDSSICPDQEYSCPYGYFCVLNVLCLEGSMSQYSPLSLIVAGAVTKFIEEQVSTECLQNIESSVMDFVNALNDFDAQYYERVKTDLENGIQDVISALLYCNGGTSIWDEIIHTLKEVATVFFPEVVAAYELVINGVDIIDDFEGMLNYCSDDVQDYIDCGADLGDIIYRVSESVKKRSIEN